MPPSIPRYPPQTELDLSDNCENGEHQTRTNSSAVIEIDD